MGEDTGRTAGRAAGTDTGGDDLEDLLHFIREARGFDFTGYKRSTLGRRVRKRMHDVGVETFPDYRDRLESDPDEFRLLFNTILINVTSFFRDPDAWSYLQQEILPELIAKSDPAEEIRVWSAGCSSGEEAFSLAIVFSELLGVAECADRVKIYGTDVDEEALREARAGSHSAKALEPVPAALRERYFVPSDDRFLFRTDLRRRVIFGRHDITRDAPISRLDLLVCRNTLMYFNVEAQAQIVNRFHFALNEGGYLFLGKARDAALRRRPVRGRQYAPTPLPAALRQWRHPARAAPDPAWAQHGAGDSQCQATPAGTGADARLGAVPGGGPGPRRDRHHHQQPGTRAVRAHPARRRPALPGPGAVLPPG